MLNGINILTVRFANEIRSDEVPLLRGAVINATEGASALFHNHAEDDRLRYAYPLIQYKRIGGKAAIVCLGEGTEAIGQFFASCRFDVRLGDRPLTLEVESVKANRFTLQAWDDLFAYRISRWMPLNAENYRAYCQAEGLSDKVDMLERMLRGNILSMAKGLGIHFERQVVATVTKLGEPKAIYYKGVKMMGFDASFKTNVSLPNHIGLGKGVSIGNGMVVRWERKIKNSDDKEK